jgi:hypothetical protein
MNNLHKQTIERNGKIYHYDPDRDIFYCTQDSSPWDTWGWLVVLVVLAAIGLYLEFWPIR